MERKWRGGNSYRARVSPKWVRVRSCASSWSCIWCTGGGPTLVRRAASRAHREDISPMVRYCGRGWRRAVRPCGNVNALTPLSTTLGRGRSAGGPLLPEERRTGRVLGFFRTSGPNATSPVRARARRTRRPTCVVWRRVRTPWAANRPRRRGRPERSADRPPTARTCPGDRAPILS